MRTTIEGSSQRVPSYYGGIVIKYFFTWDLAKALEEVGEQSESDDELQTVARIRTNDWIEMQNSFDRVNAIIE